MMSKEYTISFNVNQINEINTALRIMYARRDNQNKYLLKLRDTKENVKINKRKPVKFLSINEDDILQYEETDFIPTRKVKTNEFKHNNSSDEDKENINPIINDKNPNEP